MKLAFNALIKYIVGVLLVAALLFLPAGTFCFKGGILLMVLLFVPILILGIMLLIKNPALLKKRLDGKEKVSEQKWVTALSGLLFLLGFISAGLDFRFGISFMPNVVRVVAAILFLISYLLYAEVLRENTYLSRIIKVEENQEVIDTGLYSIVRHPMYLATIILFLTMPLILGSWIAFVLFFIYPVIIAARIKNEEEVLSKNLKGYNEYKEKVRYKLIPFIW